MRTNSRFFATISRFCATFFWWEKPEKNLKTFCPTGKPAESCRLRFKHRRGITCQGIAVWQKGKMALGRARGMLLAWGIGTFFCDTRTHHFCKAELRHHTKDIWHLEVRLYFFSTYGFRTIILFYFFLVLINLGKGAAPKGNTLSINLSSKHGSWFKTAWKEIELHHPALRA